MKASQALAATIAEPSRGIAEAIQFECYLCQLAGEPSQHKGLPPGYDYGSKLPVCARHVTEPTSVDTRQSIHQIEPREVCGMCSGRYVTDRLSRLLPINGKNWIIDPTPGSWCRGEPSGLCDACLKTALLLMVERLAVSA